MLKIDNDQRNLGKNLDIIHQSSEQIRNTKHKGSLKLVLYLTTILACVCLILLIFTVTIKG